MDFSQYVLDTISSIDYVVKDHDSNAISLLQEASDKATDETDFHILKVIAGSISMYYNEKEHSFGPLIVMDGKRTFAPEDIDKNDLDILRSAISVTGSPYIRTKLSHIVWIITKDNRYGEKAVDGYLDGFKNKFNPDEWIQCYGQIKCAYHIASIMGKKSEKYKKVQLEINQTLTKLNGLDSSFLSLKLLKLIVEDASKEDLIKYEPIIENIANRSFGFTNGNAHLADETFFVYKKIYERLQKNEEVKTIKERYAGYYEAQAKSFEDKRNYLSAVAMLKKACSLFADTNHEKLSELRLLLEDLQKKSLQEMQIYKYEFNPQSTYNIVEQLFKDLSLPESIIQFGRMSKIYNKEEIKNKLIEDQGHNVFTSLFGSVMLNEQGQAVQDLPSVREALNSGNSDAIEKHMIHYVAEQRKFHDAILVGIAYQFFKKHTPIKENDLDFLVQNNAIIPKNRAEIIKQGLCLGLNGNLYAAMHILQPQTENLFRNLVKLCEDTVTFLNEDGTEKYKPLSSLFKSEKLLDCYDNNIIFTFNSMMDDPTGENFRNLTGHGLLEPELGNSSLSLCFLSLLIFWLGLYSSEACSIMNDLIERNQNSKEVLEDKSDETI